MSVTSKPSRLKGVIAIALFFMLVIASTFVRFRVHQASTGGPMLNTEDTWKSKTHFSESMPPFVKTLFVKNRERGHDFGVVFVFKYSIIYLFNTEG